MPVNKACLLFLAFQFFCFPAFTEDLIPFTVRNFTKQEYQAESQNWSVSHDSLGNIYIANNSGLLEFDGVEWNFMPSPNGNILRSVAVDQNQRIYTSGYREIGYWEKNEMGSLVYYSLNEKASPLFSKNEEFWTTIISENKIYFQSFSSVFIYENESFRVIRAPGSTIFSACEINGRLFVNLSEKGLYVLEGDVFVPYLTHPVLTDNQVLFNLPYSDSSMLVGTASDGLFLMKGKRLEPFLESRKDFFSGNKINRGAISRNGNIIIGTLLGGILIFDHEGREILHIDNNNGLQNNTILGIDTDQADNIWLSLDQGIDFISFLSDPSYTLYTTGETGAVYSAAFHQDHLYLCTNQGVFARKGDEKEKDDFSLIPGSQGQAWSAGIYDNQLLISHNNGTFRITGNKAELISGVTGGFSLVPNPASNGGLVQSTYSYIVFYNSENGKWQQDHLLTGFSDLIRYLEFDHLNDLWASHMHRGIYRLRLNDSQDSILDLDYYGSEVFGKDFDIQVFKIEERVVFTSGEKFYTYNDLNDSIIEFESLNKNLDKYKNAHRLIPGPDHQYWFIAKNAIALYRIQNNQYRFLKEYPIALFRDHLIPGYENIIPLGESKGLLCLDNGYAILNASEPDLSRAISQKELVLKSVRVTGRNGMVEHLPLVMDGLRIAFKKNSLSMNFSFPMHSHNQVLFQSFVEGLDKEWSDGIKIPEFTFTRVPPGEYTIQFRAFNEWGKESLISSYKIHVLPPWYLSKLSFIALILILLGVSVISRHYLINRIKARERKLRESKEKELIHLRNEKLNAELSFKSQELANSTMSIIKKNEFLLQLKEIIKKQKEDLGSRFPDKYSSQLIKKIDQNISSMDDWNVFEIHFEKAHEKFLQKLMSRYPQLSHSDLRLCAYLRMNLTSKEIAPLLRISVRGVENHRYKLRKKLKLKNEENLTDYILSI